MTKISAMTSPTRGDALMTAGGNTCISKDSFLPPFCCKHTHLKNRYLEWLWCLLMGWLCIFKIPQKVNWKERVLTLLSNPYPNLEFLFVKLERLDGIMDIRGGWKAGGTGAWAWGVVATPQPRPPFSQWWVCSSFTPRHTFSLPLPHSTHFPCWF